MADEPWADEIKIPEEMRTRLLIKHVDGPLFFGFAHAFRKLSSQATDGKMLVLRMERVSYMDQSGIYALQDVLIDLDAANLRVFLVGLSKVKLTTLKRCRWSKFMPRENVLTNSRHSGVSCLGS